VNNGRSQPTKTSLAVSLMVLGVATFSAIALTELSLMANVIITLLGVIQVGMAILILAIPPQN
jgi:hypothetical protein